MKTEIKRILIVDDEPEMVDLLRMVLSAAGFQVLAAQNASDALRLALTQAPDLAVLDIHMPDTSGLDLAHSLTNETSVPFVFFTASPGVEEVQKATEMGALGYLTKPFNTGQVVPFITVSLARAAEKQRMKEREAYLQTKAENSRVIGAAVGLLMAKHPINEEQAFKRLHDHARAHREKIVDLAKRLVNAQENVNLM